MLGLLVARLGRREDVRPALRGGRLAVRPGHHPGDVRVGDADQHVEAVGADGLGRFRPGRLRADRLHGDLDPGVRVPEPDRLTRRCGPSGLDGGEVRGALPPAAGGAERQAGGDGPGHGDALLRVPGGGPVPVGRHADVRLGIPGKPPGLALARCVTADVGAHRLVDVLLGQYQFGLDPEVAAVRQRDGDLVTAVGEPVPPFLVAHGGPRRVKALQGGVGEGLRVVPLDDGTAEGLLQLRGDVVEVSDPAFRPESPRPGQWCRQSPDRARPGQRRRGGQPWTGLREQWGRQGQRGRGRGLFDAWLLQAELLGVGGFDQEFHGVAVQAEVPHHLLAAPLQGDGEVDSGAHVPVLGPGAVEEHTAGTQQHLAGDGHSRAAAPADVEGRDEGQYLSGVGVAAVDGRAGAYGEGDRLAVAGGGGLLDAAVAFPVVVDGDGARGPRVNEGGLEGEPCFDAAVGALRDQNGDGVPVQVEGAIEEARQQRVGEHLAHGVLGGAAEFRQHPESVVLLQLGQEPGVEFAGGGVAEVGDDDTPLHDVLGANGERPYGREGAGQQGDRGGTVGLAGRSVEDGVGDGDPFGGYQSAAGGRRRVVGALEGAEQTIGHTEEQAVEQQGQGCRDFAQRDGDLQRAEVDVGSGELHRVVVALAVGPGAAGVGAEAGGASDGLAAAVDESGFRVLLGGESGVGGERVGLAAAGDGPVVAVGVLAEQVLGVEGLVFVGAEPGGVDLKDVAGVGAERADGQSGAQQGVVGGEQGVGAEQDVEGQHGAAVEGPLQRGVGGGHVALEQFPDLLNERVVAGRVAGVGGELQGAGHAELRDVLGGELGRGAGGSGLRVPGAVQVLQSVEDEDVAHLADGSAVAERPVHPGLDLHGVGDVGVAAQVLGRGVDVESAGGGAFQDLPAAAVRGVPGEAGPQPEQVGEAFGPAEAVAAAEGQGVTAAGTLGVGHLGGDFGDGQAGGADGAGVGGRGLGEGAGEAHHHVPLDEGAREVECLRGGHAARQTLLEQSGDSALLEGFVHELFNAVVGQAPGGFQGLAQSGGELGRHDRGQRHVVGSQADPLAVLARRAGDHRGLTGAVGSG